MPSSPKARTSLGEAGAPRVSRKPEGPVSELKASWATEFIEMAATDELLSISSGEDAGLMSEDDEGAAYLTQVFEILLKLCVLSSTLQAPLYAQQDLEKLDSIMDDGGEQRGEEIKNNRQIETLPARFP
jgi:hypothetical protein